MAAIEKPLETFYNVNEVAERMGFRPRTIRRYIREGKIAAVKIGWEWLVPKEEVDRLTEPS